MYLIFNYHGCDSISLKINYWNRIQTKTLPLTHLSLPSITLHSSHHHHHNHHQLTYRNHGCWCTFRRSGRAASGTLRCPPHTSPPWSRPYNYTWTCRPASRCTYRHAYRAGTSTSSASRTDLPNSPGRTCTGTRPATLGHSCRRSCRAPNRRPSSREFRTTRPWTRSDTDTWSWPCRPPSAPDYRCRRSGNAVPPHPYGTDYWTHNSLQCSGTYNCE